MERESWLSVVVVAARYSVNLQSNPETASIRIVSRTPAIAYDETSLKRHRESTISLPSLYTSVFTVYNPIRQNSGTLQRSNCYYQLLSIVDNRLSTSVFFLSSSWRKIHSVRQRNEKCSLFAWHSFVVLKIVWMLRRVKKRKNFLLVIAISCFFLTCISCLLLVEC